MQALVLLLTLNAQQYPAFPSETPAKVTIPARDFDYRRENAMIPMRDGVKLFTVILVPKSSKSAPILLTRTPYDAKALTSHAQSVHLDARIVGNRRAQTLADDTAPFAPPQIADNNNRG